MNFMSARSTTRRTSIIRASSPPVSARLGHLRDLGVNAIEIMPVGEFAGERSWGYNPAQIFSVETVYGGPLAFKQFVKRAHQEGIAVILDVVYNHLGPSDLDLWQFDGWSENNRGGIYFYNDDRANTPWGQTRPDYGRGEVRQYLLDNALMWLEEYHVDGLRFDCTEFIRSVNGSDDAEPTRWVEPAPMDQQRDRAEITRAESRSPRIFRTTSGSLRTWAPAVLGLNRNGTPCLSIPFAKP